MTEARYCLLFEEDTCTNCGGCGDDDTEALIEQFTAQGHTTHCAARQVWGDGECECELKGIIPGPISRLIVGEAP